MESARMVSGYVQTIRHASLTPKNAMGKSIATTLRLLKVEKTKMIVVRALPITMNPPPPPPPLSSHAPQPRNPGWIQTSWRALVLSAQQAHQLKMRVPMSPRRDGIQGTNRHGGTGTNLTNSTAGGTSSSQSQDVCQTLCQRSACGS